MEATTERPEPVGPIARPDIVPDGYIVSLKSYLTPSEVQAHCDMIRGLCASVATTTSGDETFQPSILQFSMTSQATTTAALSDTETVGESLCGYAGVFTPEIVQKISESQEVAVVEPDKYVYTCAPVRQPLPGQGQPDIWGLSRISHDATFDVNSTNTYDYDTDESGTGTYAYVIDTGVDTNHPEFQNRAVFGTNTVPGSGNSDTNGHGTHVAGTIGSRTYGVAKNTRIISVKVYPDSTPLNPNPPTTTSALIAGLDWSVTDASRVNPATGRPNIYKSVANISSGGELSSIFNQHVAEAVRRGMVVVVAAGNAKADALNRSPASAPEAITVGATDKFDRLAGFSNWGRILDILAPGQDILSTWHNPPNSTRTISGTSMAAPHVAGLPESSDQELEEAFRFILKAGGEHQISSLIIVNGHTRLLTGIFHLPLGALIKRWNHNHFQ